MVSACDAELAVTAGQSHRYNIISVSLTLSDHNIHIAYRVVSRRGGKSMLRKASMTAAISKSEPERLTRLSDLCSEAAGHVARARMALNVETFDTDQALAHLDDAIGCLRRLLAHSKTGRQAATVHTLRSA